MEEGDKIVFFVPKLEGGFGWMGPLHYAAAMQVLGGLVISKECIRMHDPQVSTHGYCDLLTERSFLLLGLDHE